MHKYVLNIILFIFIGYTISAQTTEKVTHYSIDNGLSQSSITCIFQSSDGIIWLGTRDGLNFFDGYNFINLRNSSTDTNSISHNYITDICEGNNGDIIIATLNGITIWKRNKNIFKRINIVKKEIASIKNNKINQVVFSENIIWALTKNELIKIDENSIKKYNYVQDNNDLTTSKDIGFYSITNLIIDKNKNIWFATPYGLKVFYPKSERFFNIYDNSNSNFSNNRVQFIVEKSNFFWIGTYNGLNKFNKKTGSYDSSYFYNNNFANIKENTINSIFIDTNNTFWLGTNNGLKTFDGKKICDFNNDAINSLNGEITGVFKDNSNNIWIGTKYSGAYKISLDKPKFKNFTALPYKNKYVFSIYVDKKNQIWIGSKGLIVIDQKSKKIIFQNNLINDDKNIDIVVYSLTSNKNNIIATTNNGIFIIDKNTFKTTRFKDKYNLEEDNVLINNAIYKTVIDKNGIYWFSSGIGLFKFDGKKIKLIQHKKNDKNSIVSNILYSLLEDGNKIWLGTIDGLCLFDKKTEKSKNWTTKNGLPNNNIINLYKENDSILWINTGGGLSKFNIKSEKFLNFTKETNNFVSDFFYEIVPDTKNNFWLSSNYGIVKYNKTKNSFHTYTKQDGLPFLEFNGGASFKTKDYVFFGGIGGLVWCKINEIENHELKQKVVITKIIIQNSFEDKKIIFFPDSTKTYRIKYNENINIHFAITDYHNSSNNKYQYRILGINEDWSEVKKENTISLIGLSAGKYDIQIRGANSFDVWNNNVTNITIDIIPPFYKTLFSKIIIVAFFLSLIMLIFFFIFRNIKIENRALQDKNIVLKQIDYQKKLLEDKNKNIIDSINYAKKIIEALLPPINQFQNILPKSFIYFVPKDIVSGDFYWFSENNYNIFIASVDCTGHGIPGAFMSIIGINLLNSIVNEGISDPSIILNMMNKKVILTLKKTLYSGYLKDGMDMSLCVIDKKRKTINIASAYNPVYIIRDNNIIQFKGERKSVGNDFNFDSFSTFSVKIRKDDVVYLFSDGYTDQFGGAEQKKFKFRRFRFVLLSIYQLAPEKQKEKLKETIEKWMTSNEQVDDILIIGFKPMSFITE